VLERIRSTAVSCGRDPDAVRLVAVSKTVPAERTEEAIREGVTILGENYVQEAAEKIDALSAYPVSWHFIGHLQSNKAKYVVKLFDMIHSVDSEKLARELDKQAKKIDKVQDILIQVNISEERSKSGIHKQDTLDLIRGVGRFENLAVKGLMTMPPFFDDPDRARPFFAELRNLRDLVSDQGIPGIAMDELSMGMTGDFEVAIEEGATLVRIGTAIFGERM
jgi:PLP dependent protein